MKGKSFCCFYFYSDFSAALGLLICSVTVWNLPHDCTSFLPIASLLLEITAGCKEISGWRNQSFFFFILFLYKWIEGHIHFVILDPLHWKFCRWCFIPPPVLWLPQSCWWHFSWLGQQKKKKKRRCTTDSYRNPSSKGKCHLSDPMRNAFSHVFAVRARAAARAGYVGLCIAEWFFHSPKQPLPSVHAFQA